MNEQQIRQIIREEIERILGRYSNVPFSVEKSLSRRLNLDTVPTIEAGSKGATSEDQAVNEAGAGTYTVLKSPDSYKLLKNADGTIIGYVAVWSS